MEEATTEEASSAMEAAGLGLSRGDGEEKKPEVKRTFCAYSSSSLARNEYFIQHGVH